MQRPSRAVQPPVDASSMSCITERGSEARAVPENSAIFQGDSKARAQNLAARAWRAWRAQIEVRATPCPADLTAPKHRPPFRSLSWARDARDGPAQASASRDAGGSPADLAD